MLHRTSGIVKFFDDNRGYGFVTNEKGGGDVFLHVTTLAGREVCAGTKLDYSYVQGERGLQVLDIDNISVPSMEFEDGQIKFINLAKGYGIVTLDDGRDAFLHVSLVKSKLYMLDTGSRVRVRVSKTPKGWKVAEAQC